MSMWDMVSGVAMLVQIITLVAGAAAGLFGAWRAGKHMYGSARLCRRWAVVEAAGAGLLAVCVAASLVVMVAGIVRNAGGGTIVNSFACALFAGTAAWLSLLGARRNLRESAHLRLKEKDARLIAAKARMDQRAVNAGMREELLEALGEGVRRRDGAA